ncbi:MAG TPA: hypothetical protein VHB46_11370 [Burkholderiales bacterium]|nr:hypothetical protein [Burkholderiales bacterium]
MNRHQVLRESIHAIARRAGIDRPVFHLTSVSRDDAGVFIMQTNWPDGKLICDSLARAVTGFPPDSFTTCVALLPDLVNEIIGEAKKESDFARERHSLEMHRQ